MPFDKFSNSIFPGTKPQSPWMQSHSFPLSLSLSLSLSGRLYQRSAKGVPVCNRIEIESKEKKRKRRRKKNEKRKLGKL